MKIEGEDPKHEVGEEHVLEGLKGKTRNMDQQQRQRTTGNSFNRFEVERRNSSQRKKSLLQSERAQILADTYTTKERISHVYSNEDTLSAKPRSVVGRSRKPPLRNGDTKIKSIVVRNS